MEPTQAGTQQTVQARPVNKNWLSKIKPKYIWWTGSAIAVGYVANYFYRQYHLAQDVTWRAAGFVPNKITMNEADLSIKMKMTNKSDVDYYIQDQVYNVYVNGNFIGVIQQPAKIYIAPNRTTDVWLNVRFNPLQVVNLSWEVLKNLLIGNTDAVIQIQGNAHITTLNGLIPYNYPVDETFKLSELIKGN